MKTTLVLDTVNLGNGHVGLAINGKRVERMMTRSNGSIYYVPESLSNLREIRITEIDPRWSLPFMNGIAVDGVLAIRPDTEIVNNLGVNITYDQSYSKAVCLAVSVLSYGGHYSRAVNVGIEAILRNDQRTLRRLVQAAHDDTGLIEALQAATGKKLAYLAHEF